MIGIYVRWNNEIRQLEDRVGEGLSLSDLLAVCVPLDTVTFIQWQNKKHNEIGVYFGGYWSLGITCLDARLSAGPDGEVRVDQRFYRQSGYSELPIPLDPKNWRGNLNWLPSNNPDPCIRANYSSPWVNFSKKTLLGIDPEQEVGDAERPLEEEIFKNDAIAEFSLSKTESKNNNCIILNEKKKKIKIRKIDLPRLPVEPGTGIFIKGELRSIAIDYKPQRIT